MSLDTYANLKTEISNHLDRDDLSSDVDTFIDLAEARHKREVRVREMMTRAAVTVNARQISLPTGYLQMITFRLLTDPVTVMTELNYHEMNRRRSGVGKPTEFTVANEIEFNKSPDDSYSGEMVYFKSLTALSDANTTNDILTNYPDLYLYGSLLAAEPFLMNDVRIATWANLYKSALDAANGMTNKKGGPLISRVAGSVY